MTESVFFWIFAVLTVLLAAQVVLRRNPVHAAVSLVGAFFFLSGIYLLLDMARTQPGFGSVKGVGQALYIASVLPFEVTSLLLTIAVVGAVVVAKGKI